MVRTRINVSAEEALTGTLTVVINLRISYSLPVSPCSCVGLDHRALRSHPAGALWAEPVLHRPEAHRHCPVRAAAAGGEPQLWWVHHHGAWPSWETAFYPHPVHTLFGETMKTDSTHASFCSHRGSNSTIFMEVVTFVIVVIKSNQRLEILRVMPPGNILSEWKCIPCSHLNQADQINV